MRDNEAASFVAGNFQPARTLHVFPITISCVQHSAEAIFGIDVVRRYLVRLQRGMVVVLASATLCVGCSGSEPAQGLPRSAGGDASASLGGSISGGGAVAAGAAGAAVNGGVVGISGMSGAEVGGGGAGAGGLGGAGGAAGTSSGGTSSMPSPGCGTLVTDSLGQFVFDKTIMVAGTSRKYSLRLPSGYDSKTPYRTIFSLHGCNSHHDELINIQNAIGFDAIIIAPEQVSGGCFDDQSSMSKDLPVFDALVQWSEDNLCVDKARIFAIGFSSGSWMANILGCERAGVIRGKANVSGGITGAIDPTRDCKGNVAGIFLHDKDDTANTLAMGMHAREALLQENACAMTSTPYTDVPANTAGLCVQYDGCKSGFPVVWCQTSGINHDPQQTRAPDLFWKFLSKL
jgi:polyhydroxybutyrate depolymerase